MEQKFELIHGILTRSNNASAPISLFINPSESERRFLVQKLKLDEHTLASALDPDEQARLEFEPDHTAVIVKSPTPHSPSEPFLFRVASVGIYLFKEKLVIVSADDTFSFDGLKAQRLHSLAFLALRLIYRSIYSFIEHVKIISKISEELQDKISASMENRYLLNLFSLQKSLVYYLNFINSNELVIARMQNHAERIGFAVVEKELLDDIKIENGQCYKQAEIYSNILASLMDARVSIVSNNLNVLMKTLNILTLGIMVPTLVVSAFSMNVTIPLQHYPHAFWLILMMALASAFGVYLMWRLKKW
jgi:magnesium transporter